MLWIMLSDIAVTMANQADQKAARLRTPKGWTAVGKRWFVDDSALAQVADTREEAAAAVEFLLNATGLVYLLLGLERRPKKCHLVVEGPQRGPRLSVEARSWLAKSAAGGDSQNNAAAQINADQRESLGLANEAAPECGISLRKWPKTAIKMDRDSTGFHNNVTIELTGL